jgi:colanic acid/amylovoran biosynthesis glycosyltransferase
LKIAFFVHRFPVVSEAFILNAAEGLLHAGHEVDIYALHGEGDPAQIQHLAANPSRWRRFVFRLREQPRRRLALAPLAAAKLLVRHGGKSVRALDANHFGTDGPSLVALHEANTFRGGGRYDILHCQFGTLAEPVLNHRDAGFLSGRVFVHFRGYDISSHLRDRGPQAYARVFQRADGFFTNCELFRDRLIGLGAPRERVTILPSPVDLDRFKYKARSWTKGETLRVLCVGRLVEKKGFTYAINAVARLAAAGVDVDCRIIGDGPLKQTLRDEAMKLGVSDRVAFTGAASHEVVAAALDQAHIFMAPSVTAANGDQDALINTLKEAMAAGCPFITTAHGGIPELVNGLDAGFVAPERDAMALYAAALELLAKPEQWPEMGLRARAHIEANFSIGAASQLALAAYKRAAAGAASPAVTR